MILVIGRILIRIMFLFFEIARPILYFYFKIFHDHIKVEDWFCRNKLRFKNSRSKHEFAHDRRYRNFLQKKVDFCSFLRHIFTLMIKTKKNIILIGYFLTKHACPYFHSLFLKKGAFSMFKLILIGIHKFFTL